MGDLTSLEELVGLVTITSVQVWDGVNSISWLICKFASFGEKSFRYLSNISYLFLIDEWVDERKTYSCCRYKITVGEIHHEGKKCKSLHKTFIQCLVLGW